MTLNPTNIRKLTEIYNFIKPEISNRLSEFREIKNQGDNNKIFEELSFCILSSGAGPRMAKESVKAMGKRLHNGKTPELTEILKKTHKYPDKASYLVTTREYIKTNFDYDLLKHLTGIDDRLSRRDFIADNKSIKGVGMVQASHFLRNIGFSGYAILDRNILASLLEFGVTSDEKPPTTKKRYLEKENSMIEFSDRISINIDELDLLLWYKKNNKIPW